MGTKHNCGTKNMFRGSWAWCDERAVERRRANDGSLYNARDFEKFYGKGSDGSERWKNAKPFVEKRLARNGKAYTVHEFRAFYIGSYGELGWVEKWIEALPERRKAEDGKTYT